METKLTDITTNYSKFVDNQVLTKDQLNAFIDYFDDQDRLSRINLIGVGLACGFTITPIYDASGTTMLSLSISQGTGVTTDGDLVQFYDLIPQELASKQFLYYKTFQDNRANYDHFSDVQGLWELSTENDGSYSDLKEFPNIQDMAVVLYLEQYSKADDLCNQYSCDNQGAAQISNLKVLLIDVDDLEYITENKDTIYSKNNWYSVYQNLNHVAVPRDIIKFNESSSITEYNQLKSIYQTIVGDANVKGVLKTNLNLILNKLEKPLLSEKFDELFVETTGSSTEDFQYRYDLLKDIVATHNEIKELILYVNYSCCPAIKAFPKHLMLGRLQLYTASYEYRHQFYATSFIGNSKENWQKLSALLDRIVLQVNNYSPLKSTQEIKITPSLTQGKLGEKAIPSYYNVNNSLINSWNYEKTSRYLQGTNLSYHTDYLLNSPAITNPLAYSLDQYNFFRIEGIHGKNYREALESVQNIRDTYGLNFDIKVLKLSAYDGTISLNEYESIFRDLQFSMLLWQKELSCTLSLATSILSSISIETDDSDDDGATVVIGIKPAVNKIIDDTDYDVVHDVEIKEELLKTSNIELTKESYLANTDSKLAEYYGMSYNIDKQSEYLNQANAAVNAQEEVKDSLNTQEFTLGSYVNTLLNDDTISNTNVYQLQDRLLSDLVKDLTDAGVEEQDPVRQFLETSAKLIAHVRDLAEKIPSTLLDLSEEQTADFSTTLDIICNLNDEYKLLYESDDIPLELKEQIKVVIIQLSSICCSGEKLDLVVNELNNRKATILNQLHFREYVKEHPGVRHLAGVPEGGTFIMTYLEEVESKQTVYEPSAIEFQFGEQDAGTYGGIFISDGTSAYELQFVFSKEPLFIQNVLSVGIAETLEETAINFVKAFQYSKFSSIVNVSYRVDKIGVIIRMEVNDIKINIEESYLYHKGSLIDVTNEIALEPGSKIFFPDNTSTVTQVLGGNTVVADFALPYRCCGDATSIDFIIPKEPVFLDLPLNSICLKEGETVDPMEFTVTPADGVIKAVVPEGIDAGVYYDDVEEKTKINVHNIDPSLLGQTIQFTVDEQPTTCQLIVYPVVRLSVTVQEPIVYNNNKSTATVTFVLNWEDADFENSDLINLIQYQWDFYGIDSYEDVIPTAKNQFTYTYTNLPVNEDNRITPNFKIKLGPCPQEIVVPEIEFENYEPSKLAIATPYCLDTTQDEVKVPFTNAVGEITTKNEASGIAIDGDQLIINTAEFVDYSETISFLEDGEPTTAEIQIFPLVTFEVVPEINYNNENNTAEVIFQIDWSGSVLENSDFLDKINYSWDFLGADKFESVDPKDNAFSFEYNLEELDSLSVKPKLKVSLLDLCENEIAVPTLDFEIATPSKLAIATPYCLDTTQDEVKVPFTNAVGEITTKNEASGIAIDGDQLIINTAEFVDYSETISFLEDGEPTTAEIQIFPLVTFEVVPEINYNNENNTAEVIFQIDWSGSVLENSDFLDKINYSWDFLGADKFESVDPKDNAFSFEYNLEELDGLSVTPKLKVSLLDLCENDITVPTLDFEIQVVDDTDTPVENDCIADYNEIIGNDATTFSDFIIKNGLDKDDSEIGSLARATNIFFSAITGNKDSLEGTNNDFIFSVNEENTSIIDLIGIAQNLLSKVDGDDSILETIYTSLVKLFFDIIHCQIPEIWDGKHGDTIKTIMTAMLVEVLAKDGNFVEYMNAYGEEFGSEDTFIELFLNQLNKI